jgi:putative nucleotidyltransferase with HDIG domain
VHVLAAADHWGVGGDSQQDRGGRWEARPVLAAALRAAIVLVPALVSLSTVWLAAWLVPPPAGGVAAVSRLLGLLVTGVVVALVVERLARRLLPLVVLLKMSMLFPDRAPSRLRAARRACSTTIDSTTIDSALAPRASDDATAVADRVLALLAALASHDRRTRGHAQRVHVLAELLARELALTRAERDKLRWAALLHDIGKLGVSVSVLNKPAGLDDSEWAMMRAHPEEGARLAGPLLGWLGTWGDAIAQHHERYDGNGYPHGLSGEEIGYAGRLVCLVDAFETMTAARPYKKAMATRDARAELAGCAGSQFDPMMVRAFLAIPLPKLLWAGGPIAFLVQLPFLPLIQAGGRTATAALTAASTGLVAGGAAVVVGGSLGLVPTATAAPPAQPLALSTDVSVIAGTSTGVPGTRPLGPPAGDIAPSAAPTASGAPSPVPSSSTGPARGTTTPPTTPTTPTTLPGKSPTSAKPVLPLPGPSLSLPPLPLPTSIVTTAAPTSGSGVTINLPVLPPITIRLPKL